MFSEISESQVKEEVGSVLLSVDPFDFVRENGRLKALNVKVFGGRIWEKIKVLLANIDLSSMTREEFLDKVDNLYDTMIAPSIIAINPLIGSLLSAALNQVILNLAGKFYDNHSGPASA